jgi:hypothetical protein
MLWHDFLLGFGKRFGVRMSINGMAIRRLGISGSVYKSFNFLIILFFPVQCDWIS